MNIVEPIRQIESIRKVENILEKQNYRNLLLFDIGINTGLRISDLLALNVSDVKNKEYIELNEKKTGKFKKIPLNKKLKILIKNYVSSMNSSEPLFKTKNNNRIDRTCAYRIIKKACCRANIRERIGTHSLRKTFGYHYYKANKDIVMLQKILNHSNPSVTLRYIGIDDEEIFNSYKHFTL